MRCLVSAFSILDSLVIGAGQHPNEDSKRHECKVKCLDYPASQRQNPKATAHLYCNFVEGNAALCLLSSPLLSELALRNRGAFEGESPTISSPGPLRIQGPYEVE